MPLVDGQTSSSTLVHSVQSLYISCYVFSNKLVLSYSTSCCASFHSGDPDQVVPFVLYTVLLDTLTHTSAVTCAGRSLFRLRKLIFLFHFHSVHFIGYNFSSPSRVDFTLKSTKFCFFLLEVGRSYHSTQF